MFSETPDFRPAGYAFLIDRLNLNVIPNWHESQVGPAGTLSTRIEDRRIAATYPPSYWPGDGISDHLEFALKYDGLNPGILAAVFQVIDPAILTSWVSSRPTGRNARRVWFMYEFITGKTLPLDDMKTGNYVDLLDPVRYFTISLARSPDRI